MPSVLGHTIAAIAAGKMARPQTQPRGYWASGIICSLLPDVDVVAFAFGIPYNDVFGHRGLSHSILFAVIVAVAVSLLFFRGVKSFSRGWFGLVVYLFACTASHSVLDAMTDGGLGVAFFAPFDNTRIFFPWRPIQVSPIGLSAFLSTRGLSVVLSELVWVGVPGFALVKLAKWLRSRAIA